MSEQADKRANGEHRVVIDPYIRWALATRFVYLFGSGYGRTIPYRRRRIPVLIQLARPWTVSEFARGTWTRANRDEWAEWLRIPAVYASPPPELEKSRFCTASVTHRFFAELERNASLRQVVARVTLGAPILDRTPPPLRREIGWWRRMWTAVACGACALFRALRRSEQQDTRSAEYARDMKSSKSDDESDNKKKLKAVVTAIIDDGLGFAHRRFRLADGTTRVESFWNQDGPETDWGYGWRLRKEDVGPIRGIDGRLADSLRAGMVDEDELYQFAGHANFNQTGHKPIAWRTAHGTHVMDLAYGYEPAVAPHTRPIIGVQLPVAATADTSGGTLTPYVLDAIDYILDEAGKRPVVINLSYGITSGPHDGTSDIEMAIDERIVERLNANRPLAIVLPSGNSRLWRAHARFPLAQAATHTLRWCLRPDDRTPSYLEIWLPNAAGPAPLPAVEVQVTPPAGAPSGWVREGDPPLNLGIFQIEYINWAPIGHRGMILVAAQPTAALDPGATIAPFGVWRVQVRNIGPALNEVHAWIRRDDAPYGYPRRGRQSYFDDPNYQVYDDAGRKIHNDAASYVKCDGTISGLATGAESIVLGGFRRRDLSAAEYSAGGPIVAPPGGGAPHRAGPDALAVSEDSVTQHGLIAAGSRSGSAVAMFGTSVAAPQIARWVADEMAAGNAFDANAVRVLAAQQEAARPPGTPAPPPADRGGAGRIEFPPLVPR